MQQIKKGVDQAVQMRRFCNAMFGFSHGEAQVLHFKLPGFTYSGHVNNTLSCLVTY